MKLKLIRLCDFDQEVQDLAAAGSIFVDLKVINETFGVILYKESFFRRLVSKIADF